ncbi:zinc finger CCCH domain-containing protein 13-like [Spodoptera litura]|uniref:Zinc finger CCCH domain-containing protein 13-like n=1 Tax=Spodoptera litura TaxID=69820 RepID=A0A9J7DQJ5_SPOLT|nr:zinc finger CCCH domain-containing protein 13-like [Spodoptera litura]
MECKSSDSKKLFKVFDAAKHKRTRKKRDGLDDSTSVVTDGSAGGCPPNVGRAPSMKASLQEVAVVQNIPVQHDANNSKRDRDSSPSISRSPVEEQHRGSRSPRRHHRRSTRDGVSLALKAGMVSTPRSISPPQEGDGVGGPIPQDQDSFIYAFLEEAIKRDKKKQRHARRREQERRVSNEDLRERSAPRDRERHRHHHKDRHREKDEIPSREHNKSSRSPKAVSPRQGGLDQNMLLETFAKFCAQINDKNNTSYSSQPVPRTQSHKSLQCEVIDRRDTYELERQPVRLSQGKSRELVATSRIRSQENFSCRLRSHDKITVMCDERGKQEKCLCYYDKDSPKYPSKLDISRSRIRPGEDERYRDYPPVTVPTRSCLDPCRGRAPDGRDYRDYDRDFRGRHYDDDRRRYFEQKTSRSFDVHREGYEEDRNCRRTARSDTLKDRRYEERDKRYEEMGKYYDEKGADLRDRQNVSSKDRRYRRNVERFERNSVASREEDYRERDRDRERERERERERDRYSEKERDSGLSVADGETSTMSGRSNCLKVVKQEIAEQREAMDKMMKLWKDLMRCFKGISQTQGQDKNMRESAANVKESAAAQLRLWRECMRRYETVARDVGDTDARLMEEIKKQRSEMAEMANMWQECLQRYRDMSNDFNSLKQQLVTPESPTRLPAAPLVCAEGEGPAPAPPYRLPTHYPPHVPPPPGYGAGSPLRGRRSAPPAPPAWWWCAEPPTRSPRRRSSPESRTSRERERRHRHKDRDESRYKEKTTKPSAARSEHRHRKR